MSKDKKLLVFGIIAMFMFAMPVAYAQNTNTNSQNATNQDNVIVQPQYRQNLDLDIIKIKNLNTKYVCPGEKSQMGDAVRWYGNTHRGAIIYDWNNNNAFRDDYKGHLYLSGVGSTDQRVHVDIINARVDGSGQYFTAMFGIDDTFEWVCRGHDRLFIMDVVGKCDGTMFTGISRDLAGFNVTLRGTFDIFCVP